MDAKVTLLLYNKFIEIIEKEKLDRALRLEMELLPVVIAMENEGAYIDEDKLQELDIIISTKLDELNKSIIDKAGIEFNIDSTKQLIIILKDRFKLNPETKTQTGKESTNSEALNIMLAKNPSLSIVEDILEYRKYKKLKTTYIDSIKEKIKDGKIHATFKQLGADTGRFSSADPNMQNIPRVGEEDTLKVRNVFYAPYGYLLIVADYNQIELRVLAHFCQDTNLMEAFKGRKDVHKSTASMMFGIPISEVTKDQRFLAKALNFGLVYGMSEYGLARRIGKMDDLNYAKDLMDTYFNTYSGIKPWSHTMVMQAREVGYVRTLTGRRRHIINLDNDDLGLRKAAERRVSNTIIQGSAADIIKGAMIKLFSNKHLTSMGCKILLQVHDELVFMCPEEHVDECLPIIENIMEHPFKKDLRLPVSVAIGTAKYWGDAK
jgi:DNA polymerase-1